MDFNFPPKEGTGFENLIKHVSPMARDLIGKMLVYKAEDRISARQAMKHPYFKDLRKQEKPIRMIQSPATNTTKERDS
jgi:renal tumor antigen